jgi:hypothetical protein
MKKILPILFLLLFTGTLLSQNRKVLLEEFTGAHCGQCPMGAYFVDSMVSQYPDLIPVALHAYQNYDAMFFSDLDPLYTAYSGGAPLANIDRIYWGGTWPYVALYQNSWDTSIQNRFNVPADLTVNLSSVSWNSSSRNISATVNISILNNMPTGDYRVGLYIVEDSVTGTGAGYDQSNVYDQSTGNPFFGMGDPIVGYVHRHVVRAILPSTWGLTGLVPPTPLAAQNFSTVFNYTLPLTYNENKVHLVAYVYRYTSNHQGDEVLNAEETKLISTLGVNEYPQSWISVFPNPSSGEFEIRSFVSAQKFEITSIEIFNSMGLKIFTENIKSQTSSFKLNFPKGVYFLQISTETGQVFRKKIVIQ